MKTIKMRKEDWQKWDTALRSGEYKQGKNQLRNDFNDNGCRLAIKTYCCLGVLEHCLTGSVEGYADDGGSFSLPTSTWLGNFNIEFLNSVAERDNTPYLPKIRKAAHRANDDGDTFVEIADAIAECVEFTDETEVKP